MAALTLQMRMSFALNIQVATGTPTYITMSDVQKHAAKMDLMVPFTTPVMQSLLAQWSGLLITVDDACCELDDASLRTIVQAEIAKAQYVLKGNFGFTPSLADSHVNAICLKLPDCSHRCDRMFMLNEGGSAKHWDAKSANGVTADIVVMTEWVTPPGSSTTLAARTGTTLGTGHKH